MKSLILSLAAALTLASCQPAPVYVDQNGQRIPQQVIVQRPVYDSYNQPVVIHHDNSGSNFVAGALVGHALSGGNRTTVINRTTVVRPTTRSNYNTSPSSTGFRTTTRTTSQSTYSPSRSSSSRSSSSSSRTTSRRR